ncbi:MAG: DUF2207 domain-containing protein [Erysipelotrichaceae bacterium]|nr:DUF2207 domain-containing protein [Erysipelotrichaceae bacterium]
MKKRTVIMLVMILLAGLLFMKPLFVQADETLKASNIKVEITVHDDNTYEITETIDIVYNTPHHGIIRNIPLENQIVREDGSRGETSASITNVNCNEEYTTYHSGNYYVIKIGNRDVEIEGEKQYVISYNYALGNDTLKGADEFYLNIIGTEWDYDIEHLEVIIHMPKDFDYDKFGATHGPYGRPDPSGVLKKRVDNTMYFEYNDVLKPGEAFTVRCELEEGYFKFIIPWADIWAGIGTALAALGVTLLNIRNYVKYGKPETVVKTVEFYPPENMSPPRVRNLIYGTVNDKSVNALLLMLANKGFLTINDYGDSYEFTLYEKDTAELSEEEKMYYEGLWAKGTIQDDGTMLVKDEDLKNSFYHTIWDIESMIKRTSEPVYEKKQYIFAVFSVLCGVALLARAPIILILMVAMWNMKLYHWLIIAFCMIAGLYLIYIGCHYKRRTKRNNKLYGMALGFRDFINVTEKDRLEMLAEENPLYFYDILPYAYAMDISSAWIRKFEGMMTEPVSWYHGDDFNYFMYNRIYDFESSSTSYERSYDSSSDWSSDSSSYSSSDSGGGGVSGGGSGGGGSSGW